MKIANKISIVLLAATSVVSLCMLPRTGTDAAKLLPAQVLMIAQKDGRITVESDNGASGSGATLPDALAAMREGAEGTLFLDTAEHIILLQSAQALLPAVVQQRQFRPAAKLYLARMDALDAESCVDFLQAHPGSVKTEGLFLRDKLTPRQMRAWSLCALSVPAAMALPGSGWLWVLGGSVLACVLTVCLQVMQRRSGLCMREAFDQAFGTGGGRVAAAAELLWLLFAASGAAAASQIAFEDDLGPFLSAIPLLLAALAGQKGRLAVGRVCGALALCLAGLYAIITAASLRHVQAAWCRPEGVPADAALALCLCLAPACLAFIAAKEEMPRNSIGTAAVSALLPAVPAFLTAACLSPELARQEPLPFLTLTKSLSVMSVMQRFELLLSVAQLLGLFTLLTMLACAAGEMAAAVRGKRIGENESGMFCLLAFGGSFFAYAVPMWVWAVGAAVFWGLVPILTQVIVNIKKSEK